MSSSLSSRQRARTPHAARRRRHKRVRQRVYGTPDRPRLNVYRSITNTYAQIIDDTIGHTLVAASTLDRELRDEVDEMEPVDAARHVGKVLAERAQEAGIEQVVFDRGGFKYHGRVKALAEGAREGGLDF